MSTAYTVSFYILANSARLVKNFFQTFLVFYFALIHRFPSCYDRIAPYLSIVKLFLILFCIHFSSNLTTLNLVFLHRIMLKICASDDCSSEAFTIQPIAFSKTPIPSISQRITSPLLRYSLTEGSIPRATPLGVPVAITVPALRVIPAESSSMI